VPSDTAETAPTQRDRHLQFIAEHGVCRLAESLRLHEAGSSRSGHRQVQAGDRRRAKPVKVPRAQHVEYRRRVRPRTDERRATEVDVAVHALNRMLELGRPISVRIA